MERTAKASKEVWEKRVERLRASDLTAAEFAAETGVNLHTLKMWKYRLDREARGECWPPERKSEKPGRPKAAKPKTPRFVELPMPEVSEMRIDIAGATLHLPPSFDEESLRKVLRVIREAA